MFVWLTWLYSPPTGKEKKKKGAGVSPPRQLDLLNHFSEPRRRWASGLGGGGGGGGGESGDGVRLEFSRGFGEDVIVAQTVIMVDELTRFYLREESCSLHWPPPVSLVRHMCSWGNGLIQCLGYGTEDLSQSSEPMWRHKLPLKDLRLGSPSVSFFFCKRQKIKILLYFSTMLFGASVLLT